MARRPPGRLLTAPLSALRPTAWLATPALARRLGALTIAASLAALTLALAPAGAQAIALSPCPHAHGFECGTLAVPVLRSDPALGSVTLHIERKLGGRLPSADAVVALAGGPGQPALPLSGFFATTMAPALGDRDLVVFDQRGTGESNPLSCPALREMASGLGSLVERCAQQIGTARSGYSTGESVQDIDAIRQALGYEKLVLYGTSYGTKVALQYAQTYPQRVESMVLDSVVPPTGVEPLDLATLAAIRPVFAQLCSKGTCNGITSNALSDLAQLASRLRRGPMRGTVYDGSGKRERAEMREGGLLDVLVAGDLNPALRAMTPAAVRSALQGYPEPLLRLRRLSEGLIPSVPGQPPPKPDLAHEIDSALLIDTTCEDTLYPWRRTSSPTARLAEAASALQAQQASAFYPFDAATAAGAGLMPGCARWPYLATPPPVAGPLPDVPTLILSGGQDLRTPTSGARRLAAQIPGTDLLVVPYVGHSVLGSDFSGCAKIAVESFFEGAQVLPCGPIPDLFLPTPAIPAHLSALHGVSGLPLRAGRTLRTVLDTMIDLDRQVIGATLQAEQSLPSGSSFGGLAGGYARLSRSALILHRFSFVAGVTLNGSIPVHRGEVGAAHIDVGGALAAQGHVVLGTEGGVSGVLEGHRFAFGASSSSRGAARSARARRSWPGIGRDLLLRLAAIPIAAPRPG